MVPELIPVLGSQPAGGVSHKPGGRLPLLSTVHRASVHQAAKLAAALLRVAGVTAGLAESIGSLPRRL